MRLVALITADWRWLLRALVLVSIPVALVSKARETLNFGTLADPVAIHLEGAEGFDTESISVFELAGPHGRNVVAIGPEPATWHIEKAWVFEIEAEIPADAWNQLAGAVVEIGERRYSFSRAELKSTWLAGNSDRTDVGEISSSGVLLRLPADVRAESSRFAGKTRRINWPGDHVIAGRLLAAVVWPTLMYSVLLFLILFLPSRLPRPLRRCRTKLRLAMRRPADKAGFGRNHSASTNSRDRGSDTSQQSESKEIVNAVRGQSPFFSKWSGDVLGLALVIAGFTFLECRFPFYFVQDDVLVTELPGILSGCRGVWTGYLPEWVPYVGMGVPLMSAGGASLTYPPIYFSYAIAHHMLGNEYAMMEVFALLHLLAGFLLCKRVCTSIDCQSFAATLASLSFVFSGPILILGRGWHTFIPLCVWVPALALCLESLRRGAVGWKWLVATAICLAMPVHVGFPQAAVVCYAMFCSLVLALLVTRAIDWSAAWKGVGAVILGLSLSVPLLATQMELGKHAGKSFDSRWSAKPGLAAIFLPSPITTALPPTETCPPDFTHFYFFGGVLVWCWAAGGLLASGAGFQAWNKGASLWWWTALAFLLLAVGDEGVIWRTLRVVPVISSLARHPIRMLPFFVFATVVSGGFIFDRIWCRLSRFILARNLAGTAVLAILAYHLTRVDTALTYNTFRPYPQVPCIDRLRTSDSAESPRICSTTWLLSTAPQHGTTLAASMACIHYVFALNVYDPLTESNPVYRAAKEHIREDPPLALARYGVRWLIVDRHDLAASEAARRQLDRKSKHLSIEPPANLVWRTHLDPPWGKIPIAELLETLAKVTGEDHPQGIACGPMEWFEAPKPDALAFRANAPADGLPFHAHTEGIDVDVSSAKGTDVVVNFLRLDRMTATVDGREVSCDTDDWGRIVVSVPDGAQRLAIRYRPNWVRGMLLGVILAVFGITVFYFARSPWSRGRKECE